MGRKRSYKQAHEGEWQYPAMDGQSFVACCDCGLVHRYLYQITPDNFAVRNSHGKWRYGRRIRIKGYRDDRKTAQNRRGMFGRKEIYRTSDGWYVAALPIRKRHAPRRAVVHKTDKRRRAT